MSKLGKKPINIPKDTEVKLDSGKIILQKKILISKNETKSSLKRKILKLEHKLYSKSIISIFK